MNEGAVRGLKVAVVGMGVLIVVGVVGLVAAVAYRSASRTANVAPAPAGVALPAGQLPNLPDLLPDLLLDEPPGSRVAAVGQGDGRTVLLLQGGGPDRVVVVDGRTGQVVQRIKLAR